MKWKYIAIKSLFNTKFRKLIKRLNIDKIAPIAKKEEKLIKCKKIIIRNRRKNYP